MQNRDWNKDSRCITTEDARQVVATYKMTCSPIRFRWLMEQACSHGHPPEVSAVFAAAIAE